VLQGRCKKCGTLIRIRQDELSRKEVIERISKLESFECPGHHVEFGSPYPDYWNIDEFEEVPDPKPTSEKEWLEKMRKTYKEVLSTEEFQKLGVLKGFSFGFPLTTDEKNWDFTNSPEGKRYYFHG